MGGNTANGPRARPTRVAQMRSGSFGRLRIEMCLGRRRVAAKADTVAQKNIAAGYGKRP